MRAVVDTNVLISGLLWHGAPHTLIEKARTGDFVLVSSTALLAEFGRVVRRPKFRAILARLRTDPRRLQREISRLSETVEAPPLPKPASRDPDDDRVLATALAARADLIVSGDRDLLSLRAYDGIRIVGAAEALRLLGR